MNFIPIKILKPHGFPSIVYEKFTQEQGGSSRKNLVFLEIFRIIIKHLYQLYLVGGIAR